MNIDKQIEQAALDVKLEHESLKVAEKDLEKAVKKWVSLLIERDFKQESPVVEVS